MKKIAFIAFTKSDQNIRRLSSLCLCLILSINLSGQNPQTKLTEIWTNGNWQNSSLQTFTYDGSGYLTNTLTQTWDVPTLSWVNSSQYIYTNNPDGTINVVVVQSWDGSQWNFHCRTTYTYNKFKKVMTAIEEGYAGRILSTEDNTYDESGYLTKSLLAIRLRGAMSLSPVTQTKYTNYPNGTVNVDTTQNWDNGLCINSKSSKFTYNQYNKVLTHVTNTWIGGGRGRPVYKGKWQSYSKETNTYDGNGYLINSLNQLWDASSTSWKNNSQSNYTNNSDGTPSVIINQLWDSAWTNSQRITYTYSALNRIPDLLSEESVTIYPNPAGEKITIKGNLSINGSSYSITDQTSRLVLQGRLINTNSTIDISTLANGIYFLRFGERSRHSYKIIKHQ